VYNHQSFVGKRDLPFVMLLPFIAGQTGPKGPGGDTGATGQRGSDGRDGVKGDKGQTGATGTHPQISLYGSTLEIIKLSSLNHSTAV